MPLFGLFGGEDDESSCEETNKVGEAAKRFFSFSFFNEKNQTPIKLEGGDGITFFSGFFKKGSQCRGVY